MSFVFQAITSSGAKKGEAFLADVNTKLINKNITTDIKVDTNSKVITHNLFSLFDVTIKYIFARK